MINDEAQHLHRAVRAACHSPTASSPSAKASTASARCASTRREAEPREDARTPPPSSRNGLNGSPGGPHQQHSALLTTILSLNGIAVRTAVQSCRCSFNSDQIGHSLRFDQRYRPRDRDATGLSRNAVAGRVQRQSEPFSSARSVHPHDREHRHPALHTRQVRSSPCLASRRRRSTSCRRSRLSPSSSCGRSPSVRSARGVASLASRQASAQVPFGPSRGSIWPLRAFNCSG